MKNFNYPAPPPPPEPPPVDPPIDPQDPPPADPPQNDPPPAKPEKTYTQAQFDKEKEKWEKENAKKIAAAEAKAKLSEDDKLKAELEETKSQLRERDTRDSVIDAAKEAGVKNPTLFYKAVKEDLEFDDKGKLSNLKDLIESSKTDSPELWGESKPAPEGGADAGEGKGQPGGGLTHEKIATMSEKEIAENMDAIDKFYASQK